jgi:gas vesicle protein
MGRLEQKCPKIKAEDLKRGLKGKHTSSLLRDNPNNLVDRVKPVIKENLRELRDETKKDLEKFEQEFDQSIIDHVEKNKEIPEGNPPSLLVDDLRNSLSEVNTRQGLLKKFGDELPLLKEGNRYQILILNQSFSWNDIAKYQGHLSSIKEKHEKKFNEAKEKLQQRCRESILPMVKIYVEDSMKAGDEKAVRDLRKHLDEASSLEETLHWIEKEVSSEVKLDGLDGPYREMLLKDKDFGKNVTAEFGDRTDPEMVSHR